MKIIELLYKEGRVFFYAVEEENTFVFGTSYVKEPKMTTEETNCYSWGNIKKLLFKN